MPRFAANLSTMFTEYAFLDRFSAAADCGFKAIECQFPYAESKDDLAKALQQNKLTQVLINLPPGNQEGSERGMGALPGREAELDRGFTTALDYAEAMGCTRLHVMAGVGPTIIADTVYLATLESNLRRLAPRAEEAGVTLLIEPINTRDIPGYALSRTEQAVSIVKNVDHRNVRMQFDLYHRQIMQGDLLRTLDAVFDWIGHIQIAGVPDRHEPDVGEVNYGPIFERLDALGYEGWIGCEYHPKNKSHTKAGLGWLEPYL